MLYKRDFYTLILEKGPIPWEGDAPLPLTPSPHSVASLLRRGYQTTCAPFEVLPLPNSKCSGAPGQICLKMVAIHFMLHFCQLVLKSEVVTLKSCGCIISKKDQGRK